MVASGKTSKFRVSGFKFRVEKLFGFLATQNAKLETKHYGVRWLDIALAFAGDRPGKLMFPLTNEKLRRVAALQRLRQAHATLAALSDICPNASLPPVTHRKTILRRATIFAGIFPARYLSKHGQDVCAPAPATVRKA